MEYWQVWAHPVMPFIIFLPYSTYSMRFQFEFIDQRAEYFFNFLQFWEFTAAFSLNLLIFLIPVFCSIALSFILLFFDTLPNRFQRWVVFPIIFPTVALILYFIKSADSP